MQAIIPISRVPITVRLATMADFPFIDQLQKKNSKQLGFFPGKQMEGYIKNDWTIIAEDAASGEKLGYCASRDRYQKRDELGVIFQLCVAGGSQRKLVGASLIKHVFESSPYGCKLYCCWCAQDIDANYFWESLGFVPVAFRAGSRGKGRVHIFWQKRTREGDTTTQYWFPYETNNGAMREDRLVLPIPPGMRWNEPMPIILPGGQDEGSGSGNPRSGSQGSAQIEDKRHGQDARATKRAKEKEKAIPRGLWFGSPAPAKKEKPPRPPREKVKNDPQHRTAARELRDRWQEMVNDDPSLLISNGKYDLTRLIESAPSRSRPKRLTKQTGRLIAHNIAA